MIVGPSVRQPGVDTLAPHDGATGLQPASTLGRWTSRRISAVEGSHLVLARYSQKSSASQDDEASGTLLVFLFCTSASTELHSDDDDDVQ